MFEKYDDAVRILKDILGNITIPISLISLGIAILNRNNNILNLTIYILSILIIVLSLYNRKILGQLEVMKRYEGYYIGMLGNFFYNMEKPLNDIKHHLTYVQEEYRVINDDGIFNWDLEGYNALDEPSSNLIIKFNGLSIVDAKTLGLSVVDKMTGKRYNDN